VAATSEILKYIPAGYPPIMKWAVLDIGRVDTLRVYIYISRISDSATTSFSDFCRDNTRHCMKGSLSRRFGDQ